ncbi:hypothetical protein ASG59_09650 [Methylobacterium sp. Leaf466]|nr:hypothetical protein ASG59_09650 [Methylobacterium sp. Leaf466]
MTERVFVDTNVFLYARDDRFPEKQARARHWLSVLTNRDVLVISPQILGEIHSVVLRGKVPGGLADIRDATRLLERWSRGTTDLELLSGTWSIREETGFQWWDCVVLAAAIRAGCRYLLSEDYEHGREVRGTTILSPFQVAPDMLTIEH